jgi:NAD(P)-dependent dehydrogenase (short-subunit alcohol dehydrogenase family)
LKASDLDVSFVEKRCLNCISLHVASSIPLFLALQRGAAEGGLNMNAESSPLKGKVAIVTGAASGIGRAIVDLFLKQGALIVAEDINPETEKIFSGNKSVAVLVADASKEDAAKQAVELAQRRFGRLDILVNNAARIVYKPIIEMTLDDWNLILETTSTGVFLHSREALKAMIPNKSGSIVNIGSYACFQTFVGISAYAAAKGALAQITRTLALEAIEHGVRVNAVGAGDVVTNLLNSFREDGREFLAKHGKNAPIKRAGEPEEIAEVVAFLASDKASFVVGAIVMADGGMSIAIPSQ